MDNLQKNNKPEGKIYKTMAFRVVNSTNGFADDFNASINLQAKLREKLARFVLCGYNEPLYILEANGKEHLFNKAAEFSQVTGNKLTPDTEHIINGLFESIMSNKVSSSKGASNFCKAFTTTEIPYGEQYARSYVEICNWENNRKIWKQETAKLKAEAKKNNQKVPELPKCPTVKLPDMRSGKICESGDSVQVQLHKGKHLFNELFRQNIMPLPGWKTYDDKFIINMLSNLIKGIKDHPRKNKECIDRYEAHVDELKKLKASFDQSALIELETLLNANNYGIGYQFLEEWEEKFIHKMRKGEEIESNYPDFIFDFLRKKPELWNKFSQLVEYVILSRKEVRDHAALPISPPLEVQFGSGICRFSLDKVEGRYIHLTLELFPDGVTAKHHKVKIHIPKKYRNLKIVGSNKLINKGEFVCTFIDEKSFKKGIMVEKTCTLQAIFLRQRFSKKRKGNAFYCYPCFAFPGEPVEDIKFSTQEDLNAKIAKLVDSLPIGTKIASVDLGISDFFNIRIGTKSANPNTSLLGSPKVDVGESYVNPEMSYRNSKFYKTMGDLFTNIKVTKTKINALNNFNNEGLPEKIKKEYRPYWELGEDKLKLDAKCSVHKALSDYNKMRHVYKYNGNIETYKRIKVTLWEIFHWTSLTKRMRSLLVKWNRRGQAPQPRYSKVEYTGEFANWINELEVLYGKQKLDLRKKTASMFVDDMVKHSIKHVFFENLRTFTTSKTRSKGRNLLLSLWSHRQLLDQVKMACADEGIKVYDWVDPDQSSNLNPWDGTWLNRPKLYGCKKVITSKLQVLDADVTASLNLMRRVFGVDDRHLWVRVLPLDDNSCHDKKGRVLTREPDNTWTLTKKKVKEVKHGKTSTLYQHDGRYLDYFRHKAIISKQVVDT